VTFRETSHSSCFLSRVKRETFRKAPLSRRPFVDSSLRLFLLQILLSVSPFPPQRPIHSLERVRYPSVHFFFSSVLSDHRSPSSISPPGMGEDDFPPPEHRSSLSAYSSRDPPPLFSAYEEILFFPLIPKETSLFQSSIMNRVTPSPPA